MDTPIPLILESLLGNTMLLLWLQLGMGLASERCCAAHCIAKLGLRAP